MNIMHNSIALTISVLYMNVIVEESGPEKPWNQWIRYRKPWLYMYYYVILCINYIYAIVENYWILNFFQQEDQGLKDQYKGKFLIQLCNENPEIRRWVPEC